MYKDRQKRKGWEFFYEETAKEEMRRKPKKRVSRSSPYMASKRKVAINQQWQPLQHSERAKGLNFFSKMMERNQGCEFLYGWPCFTCIKRLKTLFEKHPSSWNPAGGHRLQPEFHQGGRRDEKEENRRGAQPRLTAARCRLALLQLSSPSFSQRLNLFLIRRARFQR